MLAEQDLRRLFSKLIRQFSAKIHFAGSDIVIEFCDHASKVRLSTVVYLGVNYIPPGVREGICQKVFMDTFLPTTFTIDEDNFRVILHYAGPLSREDEYRFLTLMENFGDLANKWKILLDERDKNDLIYVKVK